MDAINKVAGRHFNYNCKGGLSCTCPGCAGPTRTRISEMVSRIDSDNQCNRACARSRREARVVSRAKKLLLRRAKRKESRFVMRDATNEQ